MTDLSVSLDTSVTQVSKEIPPKKKYLNPYWSNKDNRHLIVTIELANGQHSMASIQDPEGTNPDMKAVLEQYTEEEIDANTQEGLNRRNENIKQQMERRESQQARARQEGLFNCKLEAFEVEAIKNSKNTELKRLIRKSKSVMEVQAYATMLLMKELENAEATD
jgi:hypothetical protein